MTSAVRDEESVVLPALTPFSAGRPGRLPAVLLLPGGGYHHHGEAESEPVARWLTTLGLHVFLLRYRVAPARYPAALTDARDAIRAIRTGATQLDVDASRIGVMGFSAGGHLAASLSNVADDSERPDFAVLGYPVISFVREPHEGSVRNLLGPGATSAERLRCSMEFHVSARTPPTFCWHTADDPGVPVSHVLRYVEALTRHDVPVELHVFPHGRHGLGLAWEENPYVGRWTELCQAWFEARGITGREPVLLGRGTVDRTSGPE